MMTYAIDTLPDLDSLRGIQARAVEVGDSKGLRFAFVVLARLVLERCAELDCALDRLSMRDL